MFTLLIIGLLIWALALALMAWNIWIAPEEEIVGYRYAMIGGRPHYARFHHYRRSHRRPRAHASIRHFSGA